MSNRSSVFLEGFQVDCIANAAVCQKFNVTGYPTLKYFEAGEEGRSFNGERTQKGLVSFMMKEPRSEDLPESQGTHFNALFTSSLFITI